MKTYSTYQECKIANPECEVAIVSRVDEWTPRLGGFVAVVDDGRNTIDGYSFADRSKSGSPNISEGYYTICNPADYCMTVEQFLKDGYRFVEGDIYFASGELELSIVGKDGFEPVHANTLIGDDANSYILRADALEKPFPDIHPDSEFYKEKRTKVEFVKVEFDNAAEVYSFIIENGEVYGYEVNGFRPRCYLDLSGSFVWKYKENCASYSGLKGVDISNLYRRVETPMTEREAFIDEYVAQRNEFAKQNTTADFCEFLADSGKFKLVN